MTSSILSLPEVGPNTLTPRPYQMDAIEAARNSLRTRRATMVVLPTGTGKTVVFATVARSCVDKGGRVLVVAHREELVRQAVNMLDRAGLHPSVERAGEHARSQFDPNVVVASVQTISGKKRLDSWPRDFFNLIVIDECHHATAATYKRMIDHFHSAKLLGFTATPDRADDDAVLGVLESVAYEMTIWDAMTAPSPGPYLCRLTVDRCETPIDLRGIRTTGGDYNVGDLEDRISPLIGDLSNAIRPRIKDRQAIVFTPDCGSASAMATSLRSLGVKADYVWGDSPDRTEKVAKYKAGDIQVLANCMLFTEGFDAPNTSAVVLCRPTKSRPLYSQMVGRGTRLAKGKTDCLLVDFAWLTDSMELVRPSDLFDRTDRADDEADIAAGFIASADGPIDLLAECEKAKDESTRRAEVKVKTKAKESAMRFVTYDAASVAGVLGVSVRGAAADATHAPATERQKQAMMRFGVTNVDGASRRFASKMLDVMVDRAKKGLATARQTAALIRNGVDPSEARSMTIRDASDRLDVLLGKRA